MHQALPPLLDEARATLRLLVSLPASADDVTPMTELMVTMHEIGSLLALHPERRSSPELRRFLEESLEPLDALVVKLTVRRRQGATLSR